MKRLLSVAGSDGVDGPGEHVQVDEPDAAAGREGAHELEVVTVAVATGHGRRGEAAERHRRASRRQHLKLHLAVLAQAILTHPRPLLGRHLEEAVGPQLERGVIRVRPADPIVARVTHDGAPSLRLRLDRHRAPVAATELNLVDVPHPFVLRGDPHRGG